MTQPQPPEHRDPSPEQLDDQRAEAGGWFALTLANGETVHIPLPARLARSH